MGYVNEEKEVQSWLGSETFESRRQLRIWTETYPTHHVRETLAKIGQDAGPCVRTWIPYLCRLSLALSFWFVIYLVTKTFNGSVFILFPFFFANEGTLPTRGGVRAAVLLGQMNDIRAIPLLSKSWKAGRIYDDDQRMDIENALLAVLNNAHPDAAKQTSGYEEVARFTHRIWRAHLIKKDLSDERADLLLDALRYLKMSDTADGREVLEKFSGYASPLPNRSVVIEAVRSLKDPHAVVAPPMEIAATQPHGGSPQSQTLRR